MYDATKQRAWVEAARRFKQAAHDLESLWGYLDDRAQEIETPEDCPFDISFDELDIGGWLNEVKLRAIEDRASK